MRGVRRREAKAADAPSIEVMGGDHTFAIADQDRRHSTVSTGGEVRVVVTKRRMVCPRYGHGCYALVFRDGWGCRSCSGCKYPSMYRRSPMQRRLIPDDFIRKLSETIPEGCLELRQNGQSLPTPFLLLPGPGGFETWAWTFGRVGGGRHRRERALLVRDCD